MYIYIYITNTSDIFHMLLRVSIGTWGIIGKEERSTFCLTPATLSHLLFRLPTSLQSFFLLVVFLRLHCEILGANLPFI